MSDTCWPDVAFLAILGLLVVSPFILIAFLEWLDRR